MRKRVSLLILLLLEVAIGGYAQDTRPTLAVMKFEVEAGWRSRNELGSGLGDILTNALVETGKFRMVERKRINELMYEQNGHGHRV